MHNTLFAKFSQHLTNFVALKSTGGDGKEELRGQESLYREEFGEQMVGKSQPVIVQLDLEDYELKGTAYLC